MPLILLLSCAGAQAFELQMPIDCIVGKTCVIQNYVDVDPSPSAVDFTCGSLTYDGHNGTDFRVPDLATQQRGVNVLAAADGRVLRARDGVSDEVYRPGTSSLNGQECGNGVLLSHGDGWETQYCHMAKTSIAVRAGDQVKAGQVIGRVGLSGMTEFPHLHLSVRQNGKVVDPFGYDSTACGSGKSLWAEQLRPALTYRARYVLNSGFADGPLSMSAVESGSIKSPPPDPAAIVAYVRVIGLRAGDQQRLTLKDADGRTLADRTETEIDRSKAQFLWFTGIKRPAAGWLSQKFRATYRVSNAGKVVLEHEFAVPAN